MSWFSKKSKEDWRLVATKEAVVNWTDTKEKDSIFYYLYESNTGRRRVEIKELGHCETHRKGKTHPFYCAGIYPWSRGAEVVDIPTYWDIVEEDNEKYVSELYKRILTPNNPNIKFDK